MRCRSAASVFEPPSLLGKDAGFAAAFVWRERMLRRNEQAFGIGNAGTGVASR